MDQERTASRREKGSSRQLLRRLLSRNATVSAEALHGFDALCPEDAKRLLARALRWHRPLPLVRRSVISVIFFLAVIFSFLTCTSQRPLWVSPDLDCYAAAALAGVICLYGFVGLARLKRLATIITLSSNKGAAGLLLRLQDHAAKTRPWREIGIELETAISESLTRLLARLEKNDRALLDRYERRLLCKLIIGDRREPAHAALEAVTRFADPEDISFLAWVANSQPAGRQKWTVYPGMRERAFQGVLKIEERRKRDEAGGSLLRPSEAPNEEILLRTPTGAEIDSSNLLRSATEGSL